MPREASGIEADPTGMQLHHGGDGIARQGGATTPPLLTAAEHHPLACRHAHPGVHRGGGQIAPLYISIASSPEETGLAGRFSRTHNCAMGQAAQIDLEWLKLFVDFAQGDPSLTAWEEQGPRRLDAGLRTPARPLHRP